MTGRYTIRYGFQKGVLRPNQPRGIPLDEKLLPEAMKDCGYKTEMFGKWHVGMFHEDYQPHRRGFDHFSGILTGGTDFYGHRKCFKSKKFGLQCGYDYRESFANKKREDIKRDVKGVYSNDIIVDGKTVFSEFKGPKKLSGVKRSLEDRKKQNQTDPMFTYLSFQSAQQPMQAPFEYHELYRKRIE